MKTVAPRRSSFFEITVSHLNQHLSPRKHLMGEDIAMLSCLSPIALSFVICLPAEAQALVHQEEQNHVIGCFPHLCP